MGFFDDNYNANVIKRIFDDSFDLPIRWDGKDFLNTLETFFEKYKQKVKSSSFDVLLQSIEVVCDSIIDSVRTYLNGYSYEAFESFYQGVFSILMGNTLFVEARNVETNIEYSSSKAKELDLFRARKVVENRNYERKEIFHTPFNMRNKITTSRYSIAGYPSLYLSSCVDLCLEELNSNINPGRYIVSKFKIDYKGETRISILDLGLKPSDFWFFENQKNKSTEDAKKYKRQQLLKDKNFYDNILIQRYLLWYPLIAACSFVRVNKNDPFAVEYIIPQLLMQAVRLFAKDRKDVVGIRYFSCSSLLASDMGFNYVFPTLYDGSSIDFCNILKSTFVLTEPVFLNEYVDTRYLENSLKASRKFDHIR